MAKHYNCLVCNKRTKPKERRTINKSVKSYLTKKLFITTISEFDIICNTCKHKYYKAETQTAGHCSASNSLHREVEGDYIPRTHIQQQQQLRSPPSVPLNIPSAPSTHSRCVVCKRAGPKLVVVSAEARLHAVIHSNIVITSGTRCCPVHLTNEGKIQASCFTNMPRSENAMLSRTAISRLVHQLRDRCCQEKAYVDFDNMNNDDCKNLTGLSCENFEDVCRHIIDKVKNTPSRTARTSIGLFLLKMKAAMSNKLLATIFGIGPSSVRRAITTVRKAMMRSFVPLYLGLESVTREQVMEQYTTPLSKTLLNVDNNSIVLVMDGTYIYIQKSNNFTFQRQSYSVHKCRPLVKPMVVVSTTGHFITIMGPYVAKNNDASILNHMIKQKLDDIKGYIKDNDVIVLDRGFRDSVSLLEQMGIRTAMPTFMKKGEKQMKTEDANTSRFVTKIRWVVESANARIKSFKYLDKVLPTSQVPFIGDYVRIVCAIANLYLPKLKSNEDGDRELANAMIERSKQINILQTYVEEQHLERRTANWTPVEESALSDFPRLTDEQLRTLTCGVYQLKLSYSYIQEHIDGESDIHVFKDDPYLIRVRIQSRHTSSKKYLLWIKYSVTDVCAWYCKCRAGARVVGVCAHIAAVIWYLSKAQHEHSTGYRVRNWGEYLTDTRNVPESIDSSDAGSEMSVVEE